MGSEPLMPSIDSLYAGQTIFMTGATGFVGKVVVEKLLRDVPSIRRIFILARAAKGLSAQQRWDKITNGILFNHVRAVNPGALAKMVPVEGDISIDDFGLKKQDLTRILEETSVVLHCAATIRFNDKLRSAIELNMRGVARMIILCKRMPQLKCYLHCSTCYVNVDKPSGLVEEKQYDVVCDPYKLIEAPDWMTDEMLEGVIEGISKQYFNSYCFTKHVAEDFVRRECGDLPTLIFRPSIIAGIWKDGIPGWADAFQGVTANALGFGTGMIPRMPCDTTYLLDIIPVDIVSNMMIACAAYRLHLTANNDRSLPIFHCNAGHLNPLPTARYRDICGTFFHWYPLEKSLLSPAAGTRGTAQLEAYFHQFKHRVVGPTVDKAAGLLGKKPFWEKTFGKLREVYGVFIPFVSKKWIYKTENMLALIDRMQADDVERFDFDVRKVDWGLYISDVIFGMKTFLTKSDIMSDKKMNAARIKTYATQSAEFLATLFFGWLISVILTFSLSSLNLAFVLGFAVYYYFNCNLYEKTQIGTVESYRKRLQAACDGGIPAL